MNANEKLLGFPVILPIRPTKTEPVSIIFNGRIEVFELEVRKVKENQFVGKFNENPIRTQSTTEERLRDQIQRLLQENGELKRQLAIYEPEVPC